MGAASLIQEMVWVPIAAAARLMMLRDTCTPADCSVSPALRRTGTLGAAHIL